MGLNEQKGNMYGFVTHTWNTVKGACPHDCSYCYMKRWGNLKPTRFDEKELKTDLGESNFIFVGSSCDMFADDIPALWIYKTLEHCRKYPNNKYLFQSKDPSVMASVSIHLPHNSIVCTTAETNRLYPEMGNTISVSARLQHLACIPLEKHITIEPIIDFDLHEFADMINNSGATQINIGADSGNNNLPEPSHEKIEKLISLLTAKVHRKPNLRRITGCKPE